MKLNKNILEITEQIRKECTYNDRYNRKSVKEEEYLTYGKMNSISEFLIKKGVAPTNENKRILNLYLEKQKIENPFNSTIKDSISDLTHNPKNLCVIYDIANKNIKEIYKEKDENVTVAFEFLVEKYAILSMFLGKEEFNLFLYPAISISEKHKEIYKNFIKETVKVFYKTGVLENKELEILIEEHSKKSPAFDEKRDFKKYEIGIVEFLRDTMIELNKKEVYSLIKNNLGETIVCVNEENLMLKKNIIEFFISYNVPQEKRKKENISYFLKCDVFNNTENIKVKEDKK